MDAAGRMRRHLHAAARHHDRRGRAARHPARAARGLQRPPMDRLRLRADARLAAADDRLTRRPLRPSNDVHRRADHLHRRLARLWPCPVTDDADHLAGCPGRGRRDRLLDLARPPGRELSRSRAWGGVRCVGRRHRRRGGARPDPGRRDHQRHQLAWDLPGQRADRDRGDDRHAGARRRVAVAGGHAARLRRVRSADDRPGQPGLRLHPGIRPRLGRHRESSDVWPPVACCWPGS